MIIKDTLALDGCISIRNKHGRWLVLDADEQEELRRELNKRKAGEKP